MEEKYETLEQKALVCAKKLTEFFDQSDLEDFVDWSEQRGLNSYKTVLYLYTLALGDLNHSIFNPNIYKYVQRIDDYVKGETNGR
jgi:hypothetical protein